MQLLFWAWIGSFAAHLTSTTEYSGISRPRPRDTLALSHSHAMYLEQSPVLQCILSLSLALARSR